MNDPASPSCAARFAPDAYMGFLGPDEIGPCLSQLWRLAPDEAARQLLAGLGAATDAPAPDAAAFQALLGQSLPKIRDDALHAALKELRQ
ncbi:hypothetical protein V6B08_16285 [Ferrovibrio sp. MS7]|uniref:hypothetical protein n=1 Tax=Ferrovibrio plantarum TaxID=3119164 RepID=UPI00313747DE